MITPHIPSRSRTFLSATCILLALCAACSAADGPQPDTNTGATRMPLVTVSDQLNEEAPTGAYGAPEWTGDRRFSTTRVYLQQGPGEIGVEQWYRGRFYRDGTAESKLQTEVEIGLPYRFQLDIYENWVTDQDRRATQDSVAFELRYALADWGKLPLNPTLYAEYAIGTNAITDPDTIEVKLLLGQDLAPRWHYGLNFSCEQQVSGPHSTELLAAQGISYTLIDEKLSVGLEAEFIHTTEHGSRGNPSVEFNVGPSIQWRPTSWSHIDIVPLFGCTQDSPRVEAFIIFGIDFGPGKSRKEAYEPASLNGH